MRPLIFEKRLLKDASEHDVSLDGWPQRYRQVGRGRYSACVEAMALGDVTITRERINCAVTQETITPAGTVAFIFPIRAEGGWRVNGRDEANGMTALREGETDLLTVVGEGSELIAVSLPADRLGFHQCLSQVRSRKRTGVDGHLADWFNSLLFVIEADRGPHAELLAILPDLVAERMGDLYPSLGVSGQELTSNRRSVALFRRARNFLAEVHDAPVTLRDLSLRLDVSVECLRRAIRDCTGMASSDWLQVMRLEGARRQLLTRHASGATVTEIAMRWGFFHLGRFSQYYRHLYGELPSRTVKMSTPSN